MRVGLLATRVIAFVASLALLTGCSGHLDDAPGSSSPSTSTAVSLSAPATSPPPTVEPMYPNALPGEKPPIRPPDVLSNSGLDAFMLYFVRTIDWEYASMDTTLMRETFDGSRCTYCVEAVKRTDADLALGYTYSGGRLTVESGQVVNVDQQSSLYLLTLTISPLRVLAADGVIDDTDLGVDHAQINIRSSWSDGQWTVFDLKLFSE
jgi:hypothetical protein